MNFAKCSIGGVIYGLRTSEIQFGLLFSQGKDPVEGEVFTGFKDHALDRLIEQQDPEVCAFFRLLAVCHTVQCEEVEGKIEYQV